MAAEFFQTNCKDIKERGAMLLATREWSDCTLVVGPDSKEFRAHKLMLSMASPLFQLFFEHDAANDTFLIPDVDAAAFEALLCYIYTEKINISAFKEAHSLYLVAEKYLIPQLAKVCSDYMCVNMTFENACLAFEAGLKYQDHLLIAESKQVIKLCMKQILCHESFTEIDIETVAAIFAIEDLRAEERDLFQGLMRHVQANALRKRSASPASDENGNTTIARRSVRKALQHIRFCSFPIEEFARGPALSGSFTKSEALAIMVNIAQLGNADATPAVPMPPGFTDCAVPRYTYPKPPAPRTPADALAGVLRLSLATDTLYRRSAESPPCLMFNMAWVFKVLPFISSSTAYTNRPITDFMGAYLKCDCKDESWKCKVTVEFKLLAVKCNAQDHVATMNEIYTNSAREYGIDTFISFDSVVQSVYERDGRLMFEAHVNITPLPLDA